MGCACVNVDAGSSTYLILTTRASDLMAARKRRALGSRLRLNLTFPLFQINYNMKQIIQ